MFESTFKRPRNNFQGTAVDFTDKVRVFGFCQPGKEESCGTVSIGVESTFGTVVDSETSVQITYGIGHPFDKGPERSVVAVVTDTLRFQLISMGQFMEQYTLGFKMEFGRVAIGKAAFNPPGTVFYDDNRGLTSLGRNYVVVFNSLI